MRFLTLAGLFAFVLSTPAPTIPQDRAQILSGNSLLLPGDLHGRTTVLVLGFSQGSRDQVAAWGKRLEPQYVGSADVAYYQVAELESVPRVLRGWVLKKIRETVPASVQTHFLTLTDHEAEWKSAASFSAKDDAYVLLLDSSGRLCYTAHGNPSDAAFRALENRLEFLRARP